MSRPTAAIRLPLLLALAALATLAPVATDLYLPGFPALAADLGASASGVQLTLTAFLVGMAFGQLVTGPLSDRWGRRRPLLVSASLCVVAGLVCAVAPNLTVLIVGRLAQGFAGAGGMVIARAVIADLVTGRAAARAFTLMITIGGVAPVLAPFAGGLLVGPLGWRGLLWLVAGLCVLMLVGVVVGIPETHPPSARSHGIGSFVVGIRTVVASGAYRGPVVVLACGFGVMMAYIAASSFVYQDVVGLSPTAYGLAFGVNAIGLTGSGWVTSRLVDVVAPVAIVRASVAVQTLAALCFLLLAVTGAPDGLLPGPIFVAVAANGAIMGNASALAMSQVRAVAGAGSAVMGFLQFTVGAVVSPLVGLAGKDSAVLPALVMTVMAALGLLASRVALSDSSAEGAPEKRGQTADESVGGAWSSTETATS